MVGSCNSVAGLERYVGDTCDNHNSSMTAADAVMCQMRRDG